MVDKWAWDEWDGRGFVRAPAPRILAGMLGKVRFSEGIEVCRGCGMDCGVCSLGPVVVDLGCGALWGAGNAEENRVGVDVFDYGQHIVHNLEYPLPVPAGFADRIVCSHVFEHLEDWPRLLEECWVALRRGGVLEVTVPGHLSINAAGDPGHVRFFSALSLNYVVNKEVPVSPRVWPYAAFELAAERRATRDEIEWRLLKV